MDTLVVKGESLYYYDNGRYRRLSSFRSALAVSYLKVVDETIPDGAILSVDLPVKASRHLVIAGDAQSVTFSDAEGDESAQLYGWVINNTANTAQLYTIDRSTRKLAAKGQPRALTATPPSVDWIAAGLLWDDSNLMGWAVNSNGDARLFAIDRTNGVLTLKGLSTMVGDDYIAADITWDYTYALGWAVRRNAGSDRPATAVAAFSTATVLQVDDAGGFVAGQIIRVGDRAATIQSVAHANTTTVAGSTNTVIDVADVTGFVASQRIRVGTEGAIVQSVDAVNRRITVTEALDSVPAANVSVSVHAVTITAATALPSIPNIGTRITTPDSLAQLYVVHRSDGSVVDKRGSEHLVDEDVAAVGLGWDGHELFGWTLGNILPDGRTISGTTSNTPSTTTVVHLISNPGFMARQSIRIGDETAVIQSVDGTALTLVSPLSAPPPAAAEVEIANARLYAIDRITGDLAFIGARSLAGNAWAAASVAWDGEDLLGWTIDNSADTARLHAANRASGALAKKGSAQALGSGGWSGAGLAFDGLNKLSTVSTPFDGLLVTALPASRRRVDITGKGKAVSVIVASKD